MGHATLETALTVLLLACALQCRPGISPSWFGLDGSNINQLYLNRLMVSLEVWGPRHLQIADCL
jgi:hypothetical protein